MDIPPPQPDFSAPPPYDVAANTKLPTYEEVQREKQMEGDGPQVSLWKFYIWNKKKTIVIGKIALQLTVIYTTL